MSKVAIKGNASGTGTFQIEAPNSNTDRTLTLPDEAGTVLTDTAPSVSGDITFNQEASGSPYPEQQIKWSNDSTTTNGFYVSQDSDRNGRVWHEQGLPLLFGTADTERMRIDSSGQALLGTSSAIGANLGRLQVKSITGSEMVATFQNGVSNGGFGIGFRDVGGTEVGSIRWTGSVTNYNTSSDYRLKENVVEMTDAIDRIKALKPSQFNFIVDPDKTVDGFLAHEAQEIVPEAITGEKDAMRTEEYEVAPAVLDDDGNVVTEAVMGEREVPDYQGIDQSKLVPLLTGALQEAIAKIETLEAKVAALEATP